MGPPLLPFLVIESLLHGVKQFAPDRVRQKTIAALNLNSLSGEICLASLAGLGARQNSAPVEISVVARVLREEETSEDKRVTAIVDITVWSKTGEKILQSSRLVSVSKDNLDSCVQRRKQLWQSLSSDLRRIVQTMDLNIES